MSISHFTKEINGQRTGRASTALVENILVAFDNFSQYKNLNFLKKLYGHSFDIVLDIGCHRSETIKLLNKSFNVKMIYAFDADKRLIEYNKKLNFSNVSFIPKGVGEIDGKKKMFKYKFTPINSFVELNRKSKYTMKRQRILNMVYGIKKQKQTGLQTYSFMVMGLMEAP